MPKITKFINIFFCKIGIHDWNKYTQTINLYPISNSPPPGVPSGASKKRIYVPNTSHPNILETDISVRVCRKCMRKECKRYYTSSWEKFNKYTKEEKREMLLNKILGDLE